MILEKLNRVNSYIKTFHIKYTDIANALGLDKSTVPKYFKGTINISESRLDDIISYLREDAKGDDLKSHLVSTWLDFGMGEDSMIVDELKVLREEKEKMLHEFKIREEQILAKYANCSHDYGDVRYVPEEVETPKYETVWQGVDCYPKLVGYFIEKKDRWCRQCKKCGKIQYTYKINKPVQEFEFDD